MTYYSRPVPGGRSMIHYRGTLHGRRSMTYYSRPLPGGRSMTYSNLRHIVSGPLTPLQTLVSGHDSNLDWNPDWRPVSPSYIILILHSLLFLHYQARAERGPFTN